MTAHSPSRSRRERASHGLLALAFSLVPLTASSDALANGRFPRADQLVFVPGRPDELVLRATFGLVISRDAGATWDWVCERAIGFDGIEDPAIAVLENGVVLAGLFGGLSQSEADACAWRFANGAPPDLPIVDLTVRRDGPSTAVALAWEPQPPDATTPGYRSRFFATADNGATWAPYGTPIDPSVLLLTLDLAPSDPHRLYASGIRSGLVRSAVLFVSTDDGATWVERAVPFDARSEQGLYIAAVDPTNPDLLYLRTSAATRSRLLVTNDAGVSFEERYDGGPMLGFALSADGSQVYLGGVDDGLWVGARGGLDLVQKNSLPIVCLANSADTLYACSNDLGGFALGASRDGGATFEPTLRLTQVRGPLACPPQSSGGACPALWPALADRLGIEAPTSETPAPPSSTPEPQTPVQATVESGGCSMHAGASGVSGSARTAGSAVLVALLGVVLGRVRRRRAR